MRIVVEIQDTVVPSLTSFLRSQTRPETEKGDVKQVPLFDTIPAWVASLVETAVKDAVSRFPEGTVLEKVTMILGARRDIDTLSKVTAVTEEDPKRAGAA